MHLPAIVFGPETQACPSSAKRSGKSTAWRMPIRGVTTTRCTLMPSSRSCKGELGSSTSSPLCAFRSSPSAWQSRLGPPVSSRAVLCFAPSFRFAAANEKGGRLLFRAICLQPSHRLQRAQQHASGPAFRLARDVHAEIAPINGINIRMPGRPEKHFVSWRKPAIRMRRCVGRLVVRTQVRFHLDDPARQPSLTRPVCENLAQQPRRHPVRRRFKKRTLGQFAWRPSHAASPPTCKLADSLPC